MPKEIRISATVTVPDDIWEQADKIAAMKPAYDAFAAAMSDLGGQVEYDLVTPKPRVEKGDPAAQYAALGGKVTA